MRTINNAYCSLDTIHQALTEPPVVEVVIEVPRGSFLKRGSTGRVDFISPLPCPFNYGSVPGYIGLDGAGTRPAPVVGRKDTRQSLGSRDYD